MLINEAKGGPERQKINLRTHRKCIDASIADDIIVEPLIKSY
jgi:hypothetical protein